jgi:hypothetical protein
VTWYSFITVTPELLADPIALAILCELAAPEEAVDPVVLRYVISPRHQDPGSADTVILVYGRAERREDPPTLCGYPIVEHEPCDDPACVLCSVGTDLFFGTLKE